MERMPTEPGDSTEGLNIRGEQFGVSEESGHYEVHQAELSDAPTPDVTDLARIGRSIPRPVSRRYEKPFIAEV